MQFGQIEDQAPELVLLLIAFVVWSLRAQRSTFIDVRVFVRRSFGVGSVITFMSGFSTYALAFLLPLYYQQISGETVFHTGLLLIPTGVGTMFFVLALRNLFARLDGRLVVAGGVLLTMLGTIPFALAGADSWGPLLLVGQFAQGLGFAATTFPVLALALAGLSHDEAPHGSAAFSVDQRVGAPFGVAVIAVILQSLLNHAHSPSDGLDAFTTTFWWTFGLAVIPLLLAFLLPAGKARRHETESASAEHQTSSVPAATVLHRKGALVPTAPAMIGNLVESAIGRCGRSVNITQPAPGFLDLELDVAPPPGGWQPGHEIQFRVAPTLGRRYTLRWVDERNPARIRVLAAVRGSGLGTESPWVSFLGASGAKCVGRPCRRQFRR